MALSPFQNINGGYVNTQPGNVTVGSGGSGYQTGQVYVVGGGVGGGSLGTNVSISAPTWTTNTLTVPTSGRMELKGDQADIIINGVSLNATLQTIQDRLNMLQPNLEVEREWDQLRDLGEQYRKLEKELTEKQRAWDILKKKEG